MKIDSARVRKLRSERHWSQEQLADACGLNLRTIQRLESTGNASTESVRALAMVFEIDPGDLILNRPDGTVTPFDVIVTDFRKFADFTGTAGRFEYWWFLVFVLLAEAIATVLHEKLYLLVGLITLLPLIAAGGRRLNDTGRSGWWQLLFLAPFGFVPVFFLLAQPGRTDAEQEDLSHDPLQGN